MYYFQKAVNALFTILLERIHFLWYVYISNGGIVAGKGCNSFDVIWDSKLVIFHENSFQNIKYCSGI